MLLQKYEKAGELKKKPSFIATMKSEKQVLKSSLISDPF